LHQVLTLIIWNWYDSKYHLSLITTSWQLKPC